MKLLIACKWCDLPIEVPYTLERVPSLDTAAEVTALVVAQVPHHVCP